MAMSEVVALLIAGAATFGSVESFAYLNWGLTFPQNNKVYPVLRGEVAVNFFCGDTAYIAEPQTDGTFLIEPDPSGSLKGTLYHTLGIKYFGVPVINKLGGVIINYPPQLKSANEASVHKPGNEVNGIDRIHNYRVVLTGVDFQGGIAFNLEFTLEVELVRPDIVWQRNGKFLDPLGLNIEGRVKRTALTINATDLVGKVNQQLTTKKKLEKRAQAETLRKLICEEVFKLNDNVNEGSTDKLKIQDLCGYRIKSFAYKDLSPSDKNSEDRLNQLERLAESQIEVEIATNEKQQAEQRAKGSAASIREGGLAQADADRARGIADADVLKKKVELVGSELVVQEMYADAIGKLTTYVGSGAVPFIQIPTTAPQTKPATPASAPPASPPNSQETT